MLRNKGFDPHVAVLAAILAAVFILIVPTIQDVIYRSRHDEGYYFKYASCIADNGISGFKVLAKDYIAGPDHWIFPNPLRIGLTALSALWMRLIGRSYYTLSHLSFVSYLLFIAFCYYFCRKLFDKEKAVLLSLLTAFSPLNMAMSRRALSESVTTLFLGLAIWLFLDMMHNDRSPLKKVIFTLVFSYSILVKETNCLLAAPFIVYMAVYKSHFKRELKISDILSVSVYPALIAGSIYILVFGSLSDVLRIVNITFSSAKLNPFSIRYGGGPWFRYIMDFMLLSPWVAIFAIGYVFYLITNLNKADGREIYFLVVLITLFPIFNIFGKNVRYVMIFDLPLRLFFILMLYKLAAFKSDRTRFIVICVLVSFICVSDFLTYNDFFVSKGLYNPITTWLLELRGIVTR